jgi:hypothetical protein
MSAFGAILLNKILQSKSAKAKISTFVNYATANTCALE